MNLSTMTLPSFWPNDVEILFFNESLDSVVQVLRTALVINKKYVFVRNNPEKSSLMDKLLVIDFVCMGMKLAPSLKSKTLIHPEKIYEVLSRKLGIVPSLKYISILSLKHIPTYIPNHVIEKLKN